LIGNKYTKLEHKRSKSGTVGRHKLHIQEKFIFKLNPYKSQCLINFASFGCVLNRTWAISNKIQYNGRKSQK